MRFCVDICLRSMHEQNLSVKHTPYLPHLSTRTHTQTLVWTFCCITHGTFEAYTVTSCISFWICHSQILCSSHEIYPHSLYSPSKPQSIKWTCDISGETICWRRNFFERKFPPLRSRCLSLALVFAYISCHLLSHPHMYTHTHRRQQMKMRTVHATDASLTCSSDNIIRAETRPAPWLQPEFSIPWNNSLSWPRVTE